MQVTTFGKTSAPVPTVYLPPTDTISDPPVVAAPTASTTAPSTRTPTPSIAFHPVNAGVMQSVGYDPVRDEYYMAQSGAGSVSGEETTYISRMSNTGKLLDSMTCIDAGHGTAIIVENVGTRVYIWITWNRPLGTGPRYDVLRFPYVKGSFTRAALVGATVLPHFSTAYMTFDADWSGGYLTQRQGWVFKRRKISEFANGVNVTYGTVDTASTIPQPTLFQGAATINNSLFVYVGGKNGESLSPAQPTKLYTYNWGTGALTDTVDLTTIGRRSDGTYPGGAHEPEALWVTRNSNNTANLSFGVTMGDAGNHTYPSWIYNNIGTAP